MHRHVREDWHEDSDLQCSSTGGQQSWSSADDDDDIYDNDKLVDHDGDDSSGDGYDDGDDHQDVLQILTKDSVTVFVNAIMYYKVNFTIIQSMHQVSERTFISLGRANNIFKTVMKVNDATSAVANVDDYSGSAQLLAATTLR